MFFTKVLSLLIHPLSLGLLLVVLGGGLCFWRRRLGAIVVMGGVLVVWVPSTPLFADWIRGTLESRYSPAPIQESPRADAIVVLGGSVGAPRPPRVYPDLYDAADRVWYAARLYRAGKAPLVIASGGAQPWEDQRYREAMVMQTLLADWGVPRDSVLLESRSANTFQNAKYTAALMDAKGLDRILLVTSAVHMRRALATFRSAGVRAVPAATDYQVVNTNRTALDFTPTAGALAGSTTAIREYVGYLVYDWRGWISDQDSRGTRSSAYRGAIDCNRSVPTATMSITPRVLTPGGRLTWSQIV